jgi:cytochrome oxidase Cu insertion factor (SCO1/SenC/PrrC family)
MRRRDLWPLGAVGFILAVTASWWALALWSVPGAPEWLERTRSVCFNITESGLPDAKGWLLLVGQPLGMLGVLVAGWGREVRAGLAHLTVSQRGRLLLGTTSLLMICGFIGAGLRVADARLPDVVLAGTADPTEPPRLDRPWPGAEGLMDQRGARFTLETLSHRPALVTFAFGHCETVCPVVVQEARAARLELGERIPIVVLTLDPWRDTPGRLESILHQFQLDPTLDYVVGGSVDSVQAALDGWGIQRQRNTRTGDIVHPTLTYLVEEDGTVAFASSGARAEVAGLGERLGWGNHRP